MIALSRGALLSAVLVASWCLADEAEKKEGTDRLAEAATALGAACGGKFAVSYDWASEASSPGKPSYQGPTYCESIVKGLTTGCADAFAKPMIVEQLKTVTCRLEPGASKKVADGAVLTLTGTTLTASYDWNSSNLESETYKWLMKKMPTPGPNGPVTVEARQEKAEGEQRFAEAITSFQEKCGAKIPVAYDFASEKGNTAKPAWQGYLYCKGIVDGLSAACEFDHAALGKKLKGVQCRFEAGSSQKTQTNGAVHALKSGVLGASYDWASGNLEAEARKWGARLK